MPVIESTRDNRISSKTPCNIDLTALVDASRNHPDPEVRQESTELINRCFQAQADVEAINERFKSESLTALEERHVALLMEHSELTKQLEALKTRKFEFDGEAQRVNGRAQHAMVELSTHRSSKKHWVEMLVSPAQRQAFAVKEQELVNRVESVRKENRELSDLIAEWHEDTEKIAYKIRVKLAEVEVCWIKLQKARGVDGATVDRGTGLSDRSGGYSGPILNL
jgi:hypothetical protein